MAAGPSDLGSPSGPTNMPDMSSMSSIGGSMGMNMAGLNPQHAFGLPPMGLPNTTHAVSIAARQQQLQEQQRELERRQKELEIQRQQLIANMQERSYMSLPAPPPQVSMYASRGNLALDNMRNAPLDLSNRGSNNLDLSQRGGALDASHRSSHSATSASSQWWICQVCNSRAFASQEEAMEHEAVCQEGPRLRQMDPMGMHEMAAARNYSLGMDSSSHSAYDTPHISNGPFKNMDKPMPLAMPSDKDWLTPLHCFVRRHCVEVFTATDQDVATPSKGKRKPITVGQVGIRCPHCHNALDMSTSSSKGRERGSVYYPTTISSIYNATMNLLQRHLHSCTAVPDEIMRRYETLKADDARSGTSKRYWIESALSLGLVDTAMGIRFSALSPPPLPSLTSSQKTEGHHAVRRNSNDFFSTNSNAVTDFKTGPAMSEETEGAASRVPANESISMSEQEMTESAPLVVPDDKPYSTDFSYHLLSQMQPCVFTEADRLGKRKGLPPGFPGLACRHCFGGYGSGRFFPSSIKTLSDTSKTLNVLHNHMMRCRKCPADIRETLEKLRGTHDEERAKMKFGSQKAFFARIWDRLHSNDVAHMASMKRKAATASQSYGGERRTSGSGMGQMPPQTGAPAAGGHGGHGKKAPSSEPKRQKTR